jgi:very-short-patch-repair endonuclease
MGGRRHHTPGRVWRVARQQHGVVTRSQLRNLGLTRHGIDHRIARGRLHPLHRGVFAIGRPEVDQLGKWMAAVLACGSDALLSHESAAELWEIRTRKATPIEVSIPANLTRTVPGIRVHRRRRLIPEDRSTHLGIPVTSPVRTLADLAGCLTLGQVEAAVNEADKRNLVSPNLLREALSALTGQPGVARMRRLLDRRTFRLTDSELERRFLRLVRDAGIPTPQTGLRLNGYRVDFFWPELGLVVETDGLRYHRTPAQQARDRRRDQAHTATGLTTLRFTHAQVRFEPAEVRAVLLRVTRRLAPDRRAS